MNSPLMHLVPVATDTTLCETLPSTSVVRTKPAITFCLENSDVLVRTSNLSKTSVSKRSGLKVGSRGKWLSSVLSSCSSAGLKASARIDSGEMVVSLHFVKGVFIFNKYILKAVRPCNNFWISCSYLNIFFVFKCNATRLILNPKIDNNNINNNNNILLQEYKKTNKTCHLPFAMLKCSGKFSRRANTAALALACFLLVPEALKLRSLEVTTQVKD